MIKEIFEIESKQKNTLISVVGIAFLSFLQLYLFKNEILEKSSFEIVGVCLGLTVCWSILNIIPLFFFYTYQISDEQNIDDNYFERIIFGMGLLALCWIGLLTYISYELKLCFKEFIRLSILVSLARTLYWVIRGVIKDTRLEKTKKAKNAT